MKKTALIHLSDIHYRPEWEEGIGLVLKAFFQDLEQYADRHLQDHDLYLVISGDLIKAGSEASHYDLFSKEFTNGLESLNITKDKRIIVPGNHDLCFNWLKKNAINYRGVIQSKLDEKEFNDYIENPDCLLFEKFSNFFNFQSSFAKLGINLETKGGMGHLINNEVGVFCINSALTASGNSEVDKGNLLIDTRNIHRWLNSTTSTVKIAVMHHPVSWLNDWSRVELEKLVDQHFSILLHGHVHDQKAYNIESPSSSSITLSAPPLFTNKTDELGYAIISIDDETLAKIHYRKWTKFNNFRPGVDFSDSDDGTVYFGCGSRKPADNLTSQEDNSRKHDTVWRGLKVELEKSLKSFSNQPSVWIEPEIHTQEEKNYEQHCDKDKPIESLSIIKSSNNTLISSPPQFGLTTLAHFMRMKAWETGKTFAYIDAKNLQHHMIQELIENQASYFGIATEKVDAIIVDSWTQTRKNQKLLKRIREKFPLQPLLVFRTETKNIYESKHDTDFFIENNFSAYLLHSLTRNKIRQLVKQYTTQREIGEDEVVLSRLTHDLESMNLHRTPLNCLTLLKVMEADFDENPVNRTEVIKRVLFLLFNFDQIPSYKRRPDMSDCEHVLGWFCEELINKNELLFSRDYFFSSVKRFCTENIIDIDIDVLFDILYENSIIVSYNKDFCFKFTYWVMYFAAQRMHHNENFRTHIFSEKRYANYPELIEYYTGIDRQRNDALEILCEDLEETYSMIKDKVGLPEEANPYSSAKWQPTSETLSRIRDELEEEVNSSNLPEIVKDKFADRDYDPKKPYDQSIENIVEEISLQLLSNSLIASSRALRNSDYASPKLKKRLLQLILKSWELLSKIILVISPVLAKEGSANFEGTKFVLIGANDGRTEHELFLDIFANVPVNIMRWYGDDLYSPKMAPLLYQHIEHTNPDMWRHLLSMLLVSKRPYQWNQKIEKYIKDLHKNSYYLFDIQNALTREQKYGFFSNDEVIEDIVHLRKLALFKHKTGANNPKKSLVDSSKLIGDD